MVAVKYNLAPECDMVTERIDFKIEDDVSPVTYTSDS